MIKFVVLLTCLVAASVAEKTCNVFLADEIPPNQRASIEEETPLHILESEVTFLTEFSRFMNHRAPKLLEEFAESKRIFETNKLYNKPQFLAPVKIMDYLGPREKRQATPDTNSTSTPATGASPATNSSAAPNTNATSGSNATSPSRPTTEIGQAVGNLTSQIVDMFTKPTVNIMHVIQDVVSSVGQAVQSGVSPNVWKYICFATWFPLHEKHCPKLRCAVCSPSVMSGAAACKKAGLQVNQKCIQDVMGEGFCNFCIHSVLDA